VYLKDTVLKVETGGNDVYLGRGNLSGPAEPYLRVHTTGNDVYLYRQRYDFVPPATGGGPVFPTQYAGLRYYHGSVKELCLVDTADAPVSVWRVRKNSTTYAVYLVDTSDPNASAVRVKTAAGIKAARLKT
jgi:hypothetical protein